ncbi:MAG: potassium-transporting ATPase subunit KdpC [Candidatus Xenobiia bacterium LiM19]
MKRMILTSCLMMTVITVITGIVYPLVMTGISQLLFQEQAAGSIVYREGKPAGSILIGQAFSRERYLHGRPSAAGEKGYDGLSSSGTNLAPTNRRLLESAAKYKKEVQKEEMKADGSTIPSDLVFASAGGLDPHISPAAAFLQTERVAKARGVSADKVRKIIEDHLEIPLAGIIGEPRVNVLKVNLALDSSLRSEFRHKDR